MCWLTCQICASPSLAASGDEIRTFGPQKPMKRKGNAATLCVSDQKGNTTHCNNTIYSILQTVLIYINKYMYKYE